MGNSVMPPSGGNSPIEIVEMRKEWLGEAARVYQWYVDNSTATFQLGPTSEAEMEGLLFFAKERYRSFAAFGEGRFIGYGIVTQFKAREAYDTTAEVTVYFDHGATGKGYGALMVAHLEAWARERGLHALLAIISGENEASIKLFSRLGYPECARYREVGRKFDRWVDVVVHEKILD